jgi:PEGA domain
MRLTFCGIPVLGLVLCAVPAMAHAQPKQKAEAQRHYERGLSLVKAHTYGEAIAEFNQAYDLGQDFAVLYDIGQAYVAIDQPVFAVDAMRKYLEQGGKRIAQSKRNVVEAEISKQESRIATIVVHASVAGAALRVDGADMGKAPATNDIRVSAGAHLIGVSADGYRSWEKRLELLGGEHKTVEASLELDQPTAARTSAMPVAAVPSPGAESSAVVATAPRPLSMERKLAYALGGVSVLALTLGSVYGARAISKRHDSDNFCPQNQCSQAGVDLNNQAQSAARISDITLGVGLVSAAAAVYLWLRPAHSEAPSASAQGPRLLATIGPEHAGLAWGGTW